MHVTLLLFSATLCQNQITVPSSGFVTVTSQNYPSNYKSNTDCVWILNAQTPGTRLRVVIKDFITGDQLDQLVVGSQTNPLDTNSILRTYWGTVPEFPVVFTSLSDTMWITFKSDGTKQARGFDLEVQDATYGKSLAI